MSKTAIEVDNVSMKFNLSREKVDSLKDYIFKTIKREIQYNEFWALKNVSFSVEKGDRVGILGLNGAGKSTTMNMITGYIDPTDGEIIVNGVDVAKKPRKAKKQIGYMPESVPLYQELTVKEFIRYMAEIKLVKHKEIKEEVNKVLEEVGLKDVENKLIRNLSRGYKQRVGIAGALIGNPDVIILDEPTVGLDPKQITEIRDLIKKLGKSHTVILSSHILPEVSQICEKVIIINKGKFVAEDTPKNLSDKLGDNKKMLFRISGDRKKAENILNSFDGISNVTCVSSENDSYDFEFDNAMAAEEKKKMFFAFAENEIPILMQKEIEPSLEDIFLKLTDNTSEKEENTNESDI